MKQRLIIWALTIENKHLRTFWMNVLTKLGLIESWSEF